MFYLVVDKVDADYFKDEITPFLKTNDRIKFDQYVAMNHVIEKGNPRCKLLYKLFKGKCGYDPLLEISPFPTLIQLK